MRAAEEGWVWKELLYRYDGVRNRLIRLDHEKFQEHRGHPERNVKKIPSAYREPVIEIHRFDETDYEDIKQREDAWILEHDDIVKVVGFYHSPDEDGTMSARIGTSEKGRLLVSGDAENCFIVALGREIENPFTGELLDGAKISMTHNFKMREMEFRGRNLEKIQNDIKKHASRDGIDNGSDIKIKGAMVGGVDERFHPAHPSGEIRDDIKGVCLLNGAKIELDDTCKWIKNRHNYNPLGAVIEENNAVRFIRKIYGRPPRVQLRGSQAHSEIVSR